jgi:wobble nucleotide-excising tRNase
MIRAIQRIEDYRIFQSWRPGTGAVQFEPVNILYGVNGSGKSTLADLLQDFADGTSVAGLRLDIEETSGRRTVSDSADSFARRIQVFNRRYVQRNLRFDEPDNQIVPLLVLGEQAVDAAERTAVAIERLAEVRETLPKRQSTELVPSKRAAATATSCAQTVVADLGTTSSVNPSQRTSAARRNESRRSE